MLAILYLLICGTALAFDPAGPPPKRTLEWTAKHLMHATFPLVDFHGVKLEDAALFAGRIEVPEEYAVRVIIPDDESIRAKRITIRAEQITHLALIAAIAEQADLNILIKPGTLVLVPKTKIAEQAGAGQPATRPESKSEGGDKPQPESEGRSR